MASAAFLIYSGIMPLIKTFIGIIMGYILAKRGLFSAEASRGASQVTMNVSLPALIFANIVPAFTPSNVSALGPLFLTAFSYQAIGFAFGLIIREVFYVPRNFWQGIVILTGMSNWGNLPNAVVMSITEQPPFNPNTDPALGVSFVSIFIVSYHLVFWVAGAAHSLSWDYLPGVPQGDAAERPVSWKEKPIGGFVARRILRMKVPSREPSADVKVDATSAAKNEKDHLTDLEKNASPPMAQQVLGDVPYDHDPDVQLARRTSRLSAISPGEPLTHVNSSSVLPTAPPSSPCPSVHPETPSIPPSFPKRMVQALRPLSAVVTPITLTLAVSLPIALITDLKALFVSVADEGGPDWHGPDGRPPLAFVMDTTEFLGNIAVPLALILLGASFARLKIPRPISRLPIMAMLAVSFAKMVFLPIIGVFMVQAMVRGGLIDRDALAERFVAMFLSGTPAAVKWVWQR
ncbi:hypothetical protein AcW2_005986 [Taiwanofungus camphoratus]|nr:hypothetical protein AcW2_005986 [Antrodia cinnamomea]